MLISLESIILIYEAIMKDVNISYTSAVIFTALDVDSVCTLKILSKLFKSEDIQFKVYPVCSYVDLENRIEESKNYDQVRLFLFINCGGIIDLTEKWFADSNKAQVILFDINKPIHTKNIESSHINVIDDEHSGLQNAPTTKELIKFEELDEYDIDSEVLQEQEEINQSLYDHSPKRRNTILVAQKLRKHKLHIRKKIDNYYGQQYFSLPSSYTAYRMVRDLNKANNDYLWYAIVGLTSMFLDFKLSKEIFQSVARIYRIDIPKFNTQTIGHKQKGQISQKMGYQFTLLDHWSLYESMTNSSYLLIKLKLWDEKGKQKLNKLLTQIGISLSQAKQMYQFMSRQTQKKLQSAIFPIAQKYSLHDVAFLSFIKQIDHSIAYIASDYHHILTHTLEKPHIRNNCTLEEQNQHEITNFWDAYDLFDANTSIISSTIEKSKLKVSTMMQEAQSMVGRDQILSLPSVGFANIKNDSLNKKIFQHPCTLIRMAYILMGIQKQRQIHKSKFYKPFIISYHDIQKGLCTVAGVMMQRKNFLGQKFNEIAEKIKMNCRHDNFMANIMVIPKERLLDFIKQISNEK